MPKLQGIACFIVIAFVALGDEALGGGFAFNENGAAATGKGTAFVGEANDPSAIFYNPAGITQLPGTQLMIGAAVVKLDSTFRSATTVESTQLQDQFPVLPYVYITHKFKGWERLSIGLGIFTPFGIVIDWPDNWQGRFTTTDARLRVTVYNPTIAFQATKNLSLAAGVQVADVGAGFEQKFNAGTGESKLRAHGLDAHPIGWNVGALYHITDTTSAGIQFRSELQAKLNGDADITGPASAQSGGLFADTTIRTSVKLAPRLVAGISTKAIPRWTFNADIQWDGWRTLGTIPKTFADTSNSPVPQSNLNQRGFRNWENAMAYKVGAEFAATDRLALRGGYFYDESAIPDNTFNPTVPNANLHALTVGFGYKWPRVVVDAGYLLGFYEKRSINNGTIDPDNRSGPTAFGSYSSTAQVLTVSVTLKF
jgi:long-chain fatty acid transport protein